MRGLNWRHARLMHAASVNLRPRYYAMQPDKIHNHHQAQAPHSPTQGYFPVPAFLICQSLRYAITTHRKLFMCTVLPKIAMSCTSQTPAAGVASSKWPMIPYSVVPLVVVDDCTASCLPQSPRTAWMLRDSQEYVDHRAGAPLLSPR